MANTTHNETNNTNKQSSGMRGGTPEQHAEAGRQSHKSTGSKDSSKPTSTKR